MASYRGEDLDLRTPGGRPVREAFAAEAQPIQGRMRAPLSNGGGRGEPTYVDETVMACCNHAFDIAQAHGASEVRLDHLIHAMTRVEAAAQILEERGVREAHLRRESAAVLASQIPVGLGNTHATPRAAAELDDVLRRASDSAARSGDVAGVEAVLWAMLTAYRDHAAVQLLARHAPDWQQWEWSQRFEPRREAARPPAPYYPERRASAYVEAPPPVPPAPRLRGEAMPAAAPMQYQPVYDPSASRLDQIEQAIRGLQADLVADRRMMSDLMRDLQREMKGARPDAGVLDRVDSIERAIDGRLQELSRVATSLSERLHGVEKSVSASVQDGARNWAAVSDRIKTLDERAAAGGNVDLGDLVTDQLVAVADELRGAGEKIAQLEKAVATISSNQASSGSAMQGVIADRFQTLRQTVDQQNLVLTSAIAQLTEPVNDRLRQLEQAIERSKTENNQVWRALADRLGQIEQTTLGFSEQAARDRAAGKSEMLAAISDLGSRQQVLADNLDAWRADQAGNVSIVAKRIELLEVASSQPLQMLQQLQADLNGLQQVTLADYDQNRRGFRHWLFGTEEIFARSWRDETRQVRDRLRQLAGGDRGGRPV